MHIWLVLYNEEYSGCRINLSLISSRYFPNTQYVFRMINCDEYLRALGLAESLVSVPGP